MEGFYDITFYTSVNVPSFLIKYNGCPHVKNHKKMLKNRLLDPNNDTTIQETNYGMCIKAYGRYHICKHMPFWILITTWIGHMYSSSNITCSHYCHMQLQCRASHRIQGRTRKTHQLLPRDFPHTQRSLEVYIQAPV